MVTSRNRTLSLLLLGGFLHTNFCMCVIVTCVHVYLYLRVCACMHACLCLCVCVQVHVPMNVCKSMQKSEVDVRSLHQLFSTLFTEARALNWNERLLTQCVWLASLLWGSPLSIPPPPPPVLWDRRMTSKFSRHLCKCLDLNSGFHVQQALIQWSSPHLPLDVTELWWFEWEWLP